MSVLLADIDVLAIRLAADLLCMTILVRGIYLRYHAAAEFAFAHMMLNLVTFAWVWACSLSSASFATEPRRSRLSI